MFLVRTSYPVHGKLGFDFNTRIGRQSYSFQNHFFGAEVKSELIELSKIFLDWNWQPDFITSWLLLCPILMSDKLKIEIQNQHCADGHLLAKTWLLITIFFKWFTISKFSYRMAIFDRAFENFWAVYLQITAILKWLISEFIWFVA